jgi:hypothetical protein
MSNLWDMPGMSTMKESGLMEECQNCNDPVLKSESREGMIEGYYYDVLCMFCYEEFVEEESKNVRRS